MSEQEAKLKSAWVDAPEELKRYIGDLDAEIETLKAEVALEVKRRILAYDSAIREKAEIEAELAAKEQECERLRAELEKRKLKWATGPIPFDGFYFTAGFNNLDLAVEFWHAKDEFLPGWKWAGPIEPPKPAPDKG